MSYRSVLNVSNGGPSNPKLTLKINSLRIKRKAQNFASWMLSEYAFKIERKKVNYFFDHSTTLKCEKILAQFGQSVCTRTGRAYPHGGKELGILEWPKTWHADSPQACESFARDRSQTYCVRKFCPTLGGAHAHARALSIQTGERHWHLRMAQNLASRLPASLRVVSMR